MLNVLKGLNPFPSSETFPVIWKVEEHFSMCLILNYGLESLSYIGPMLWDNLTTHLKETNSVGEFKSAKNSWKPEFFPYRLWKTYVQNTGYL